LECIAYSTDWFSTSASSKYVNDTESLQNDLKYNVWDVIQFNILGNNTFGGWISPPQIYPPPLIKRKATSSSGESVVVNVKNILWTHLPDALVIIIGIFLSKTGHLNEGDLSLYVTLTLLPLAFLIMYIVSVLQTGRHRLNISRLFFTSWPLTFLGYVAFPVYLFQRILLEDYLRRIHQVKTWHFQSLTFEERFFTILFVIGFAFIVQKYVVDTFSVYLYGKLFG
jgi:hypothetical protein